MPAPVPFPVEDPYRMRADLRRLDGSPFLPDDEAARYQAEKLTLLVRDPGRVRVADPAASPGALHEDVVAVAAALARLRPDAVRPAAPGAGAGRSDGPYPHGSAPAGRYGRARPAATVDGFEFPLLSERSLQALTTMPAATRLADALALSLQEDLVWMRDDGRGGRAGLLHVCFPSRWDPGARGGASLLDLHGPVADGERLRTASAPLMAAIASKGPFERHVWSLEQGPDLDRHPARQDRAYGDAPAAVPASPSDARGRGDVGDVLAAAWFRVERQTTLPFPDRKLALFAIRVLVAPLLDVLGQHPDRARRLARSIRTMRPQVLRYKGLSERSDALLAALDEYAPRRHEAEPAPESRSA